MKVSIIKPFLEIKIIFKANIEAFFEANIEAQITIYVEKKIVFFLLKKLQKVNAKNDANYWKHIVLRNETILNT